MENQFIPRTAGGRRIPRPTEVIACPACGQPAGANYAVCTACHHAIEQFWLADWTARLTQEGIAAGSDDERLLAEIVVANIDTYTWTEVDIALTLVTCPDCGCELCGGPLACANCKFVFENLWAYDMEAGYQGTMTYNEHMIRVGRLELRHPHRFTAFAADGARWLMPIGITDPYRIEPAKMQAIYAAFDAGTLTRDETRWLNSFEAIYNMIRR